MSQMYFATDGTYGTSSDLVIADTAHWTEAMHTAIDEAGDWERAGLAWHFSEAKHEFVETPDGSLVCQICVFTPADLILTSTATKF